MIHIPKDELTLSAARQFEEGYRRERLEKALLNIKQFRTAVDIGAHIGSWTTLLGKRFNEVYAFEPNIKNYEHLFFNTVKQGNIHAFHYAISDKAKRVGLIEPKKPISTQITEHPEDGAQTVEAITLDSMSIEHVDFLKIHCNGHEYPALLGSIETIQRCKPIIFVTMKKNQYVNVDNTLEILSLMNKLGYINLGFEKPDWMFAHV